MERKLETSFESMCSILSEIWLKREDLLYNDFFDFNLLGVTLAYAFSEELVDELGPDAVDLIEESFEAFLDEHEVDDIGYSTLEDIWKEVKNSE
jgi:hypothetical protein